MVPHCHLSCPAWCIPGLNHPIFLNSESRGSGTWVLGLGDWWRGQAPASVHRARRAAKEAKEAPAQPAPEKVKVEVKKFVKIGRPGYKGVCVCLCVMASPQLWAVA